MHQENKSDTMKAIIISTEDHASCNIRNHLLKKGFEDTGEAHAGHPVYQRGNDRMYTFDKPPVELEDIDTDIDADMFIFATKHESKAGVPTLSCHAPGNWGEAMLGGRSDEVCIAPASYLREAYLHLKQTAQDLDHEVSVEQTHHGPYVKKPVMFIEIGSEIKAWTNPRYGDMIADAVIHLLDNEPEKKPVAMVLGGGHYNIPANKVMDRTGYAVGHICAKFLLDNLTEEKMKNAIEKHTEPVELIVLDWKGLGPAKQHVMDILERIDTPHERLKNLRE